MFGYQHCPCRGVPARGSTGLKGANALGRRIHSGMASYIVRFGAMRTLGVFAPTGSHEYRRATRVIVRPTGAWRPARSCATPPRRPRPRP